MYPTIRKWILVTLLSVAMKKIFTQGEQLVPCAFFFGDSQFDNGNNNLLVTLAKVNYSPYGIDYPDGPTGRFSNGRNVPDFLAQFLGFDKPIPPFATARGSKILKGVNYASGLGGIRDETGSLGGDRISMSRQLLNHKLITIPRIENLLGSPTIAGGYLNKCLYTVNMGSNDYFNNYLVPQFYATSLVYTPDQFAEVLIQQYSRQLRDLYNYGARKVAVFGLATLGCVPQQVATIHGNTSSCVESTNIAVQLFNKRLTPLIDTLNNNLLGAQFIYINMTSISLTDPSSVGITVTTVPCCVIRPITGLCDPNKPICSNRNEYAFWDNYHPTETFNNVSAIRAYNAASTSDAYPIDIRRLVQL